MTLVDKPMSTMLSELGTIQTIHQQVLEINREKRQECLARVEQIIAGYGNYNPAPVVQAVENIFDHATPKDLKTAFVFDRFASPSGLVCRLWDAGEGFDFRDIHESGDFGEGFKVFEQPGYEVSFEGKGNIINIFYRRTA